MNPLLGELAFAMDGVLVGAVLNDLHSFTAMRLFGTVFSNHVKLANVVLKVVQFTKSKALLIRSKTHLFHRKWHADPVLFDQHPGFEFKMGLTA